MDLSHLDDPTALLVVTLQLEDLRQLQTSTGKGKQRAVDDRPDDHHAQGLLENDLENLKATLESRIRTASTQQSNDDYGDGMDPRNYARFSQRVTCPGAIARRPVRPSQEAPYRRTVVVKKQFFMTDEGQPEQISPHTYEVQRFDEPFEQPESSTWAAGRETEQQQSVKRNCCACQGSFHIIILIQAPCNHDYCGDCIRTLFRNSLVDESMFPPRCCTLPFSPEESIIILGKELYDAFKAKEIEFGTTDRIYCHDTSCATFIPPSAIEGNAAKCTQCNAKTCTDCKAKHHTEECKVDPGTQQVLDLAAQNGWQRCSECGRIIELKAGCYHMTCPCKAQFRYLCGVKWKQCNCPQWSEERLTDRAMGLVDDGLGLRVLADYPLHADYPFHAHLPVQARHQRWDQRWVPVRRFPDVAAQVEEPRRNNIVTQDCTHQSWRSRTGGRCAECHDYLPTYLYECTQCQIAACRGCRLNRL
ncbi:hypothetical protein F5X68DRAFT_193001 [Plectosphaerella plurivora]|uniref:RBR-type E3 ubiquitin transferase n=1 Tax=Plectosphaerella plurivora TaxID=936078 RepID=A0A9P8V7P8_9PEZI|nr:hypothetical protein F5X68DRAFT_193001 [Plectosphaerella plurivora]